MANPPTQNKIITIPTAVGVENVTVRQIHKIYKQLLTKALNLPDIQAAINDIENLGKGDFKLTKQMERELDKIRLELNRKLNISVVNGVTQSWVNGEKAAGALVQAQYGQTTQSIAKAIADRATSSARQAGKTAHNFTLQKTNGLNISDRVWNCNANFKSEMTAIIQNSMLQGKSATETASQVQKYLKNPTALYRRVRNKKTGELELSEAAKKYHPGRGVYRSAYKNAMRLARTEINAAYRQAEWESYQKNPLVTGFEIRLSGNHTCLVKGIPRPFVDICDYKAGKYPKTFQWWGWHPQCRCIMIPIVMGDNEFVDFLTNKNAKDVRQWVKPSKETEAWLKELEERERKISETHELSETHREKKINKILKETEKYVIRQKNEVARIIDTKGNVIKDIKGDVSSVVINDEDIKLFKDCTIIHNHPSSLLYSKTDFWSVGFSLSGDDLKTAVEGNAKSIVAYSSTYKYEAIRNGDSWNITPKEMFLEYDHLYNDILAYYKAQLTEIRKIIIQHLVMKQLAQKLGFSYKKTKI